MSGRQRNGPDRTSHGRPTEVHLHRGLYRCFQETVRRSDRNDGQGCQSVRIRDKGEPGVNGGPRGDLLVEVVIQRHPILQRNDMDIYSTAPISFAVAALGGEIYIDTVDGKVIYEVKAGTQTDTRVRLKGKGMPSLRNKQVRGDHYVTLVVQTPEHLSSDAKDLLRQFDKASGDTLNAVNDQPEKDKKKKGFWNK